MLLQIILLQSVQVAGGDFKLGRGWRRVVMRAGRHIAIGGVEFAFVGGILREKCERLGAEIAVGFAVIVRDRRHRIAIGMTRFDDEFLAEALDNPS